MRLTKFAAVAAAGSLTLAACGGDSPADNASSNTGGGDSPTTSAEESSEESGGDESPSGGGDESSSGEESSSDGGGQEASAGMVPDATGPAPEVEGAKTGGTLQVGNGGATGAIAGEFVVRQPADGYTLLNAAPTSHTALRALRRDLPYDPMADLTPVTLLVIAPMMLVVNPSKVPARTVQELIAYLKQNPGKVTYASTGIGSVAHLSVELFKLLTGTDMVHVPYRGNAPALNDLLAGNVDLTIDVSSSVASHLKSGALRSLGVTTAKRTSFDPDMPTVAETVPGYEASVFYGVSGPKGIPADVVEVLNKAFNAALADPKMQQRIKELGGEPMSMTPAQFGKLVGDETEKWGKVVKAANLSIE